MTGEAETPSREEHCAKFLQEQFVTWTTRIADALAAFDLDVPHTDYGPPWSLCS